MYAFFALKSLPTISQTIENRAERIKNDLGSADRLKEEVESVHKSYEDSLSEARQKSAKLFVDLELEIKEQSEIQAHAFSELSAKKMAEAEKNIGAAHKKIMGENVNGPITNLLGFLALIVMTLAAVTLLYLQF